MIVQSIKLARFRSYDEANVEFDEKTNFLIGSNAAGKTNLAEAVYYLSGARSWRTSEDEALIARGAESAYIEARIREGELRRTIAIEIGKGQKRVRVNGKPLGKLSELTELVNVLVFSPGDVTLFQGSPAERRAFLDASLSKEDRSYLKLLSKAHALLRERNLALKRETPDRDLVQTYARQLAMVYEPIVKKREAYCERLNAVLPGILSKITGQEVSCSISYRPFLKPGSRFGERAMAIAEERLQDDLLRKTTGWGIHREDFAFRYDGKDVALYGSQGENRICALALKIAPYYLIDNPARKPVCVLDDVASELDDKKVANLMRLVQEDLGQVIITATSIQFDGASVIEVSDHKATRRN